MIEKESQRIVIALGIVASVAATIVALPNGGIVITVIKATLTWSGVWSFLFILMTAANMKYKNAGSIGDLNFTEKFRGKCFDLSVDAYGVNFIFIMTYFILAVGFNLNIWLTAVIALTIASTLFILGIIAKRSEER